jgi:exodeoxyribonuclease VII small subunit
MTYESDLARLQQIVAELEGEDVALERALALFEEGVERVRSATAVLAQAESRVRVLTEHADGSFELGDLGR